MENKGTILKANFKALLRGFSDLKAWAKDADANCVFAHDPPIASSTHSAVRWNRFRRFLRFGPDFFPLLPFLSFRADPRKKEV